MSINNYIIQLESIINSCCIVLSYNLNIDRKTADIAFISGNIEFRDGTTLDFKEFIEKTGDRVEKYKYAFNYRSGSETFFRYDNAPDPRAKGIKTFPHHKHIKNDEITEAQQKDLKDILEKIEGIYLSKEE